MEHCRLPIEICEVIIDSSSYNRAGGWVDPKDLASLRACALTCKAWLPRSLINLYHSIRLSGDERTRNALICLRGRGSNLAINVRAVENCIGTDGIKKKEGRFTPNPYHLVPYLLAGLPQVIRSVQTVSICCRAGSSPAVLGRPTHDSDIFLKSYGYFQSVQTLKLSNVALDTFSYFARFITCFRPLRHLDLSVVEFIKLNDYSSAPAKLKQWKLHTLATDRIRTRNFCHLARWLLRADALSLLDSLSCQRFYELTPDLDGCVPDMMAPAGASLKHLSLDDFSGSDTLDCSSNTSLQTIRLDWLAANSAASVLSTISARCLSVVKLGWSGPFLAGQLLGYFG